MTPDPLPSELVEADDALIEVFAVALYAQDRSGSSWEASHR